MGYDLVRFGLLTSGDKATIHLHLDNNNNITGLIKEVNSIERKNMKSNISGSDLHRKISRYSLLELILYFFHFKIIYISVHTGQ